jgi:hypothetical protein
MLERELRELSVAWPETPDLAAAVSDRLAAAPARRRRPEWPAWRVGVAVAAALIAVVMIVPPARSAVLEWLGLASVRIERSEPQPTGRDLLLGEPVSLEEARERAGFPLVVPAALGEPDAVYLSTDPATGRRVEFVYRARDGLPRSGATGVGALFTQFRGPARVFIEKTVGTGAQAERLDVAGDPAIWISGAPHGFAYSGANGTAFEEQRLAGNTLLVERDDGVLLRLEADIAREEAARIAASAR